MIIYVRLDLTISKDEAAELKMRISSQCELVHTHQNNRAALYERLEEEIQKLKNTKDVSHAQVCTFNIVSTLSSPLDVNLKSINMAGSCSIFKVISVMKIQS